MRRFIAISTLAVALVATVQIPVHATTSSPTMLIVGGRGWGHGRGMGQYGARAQAAQGTPWYRILPRYYTGIRLQHLRSTPNIRVLLLRARAVVLKGDSHVAVSWAGGRASNRSGRSLFRIANRSGVLVIQTAARLSGPWRTIATSNAETLAFAARHQSGLIGSTSSHWYRGTIHVLRTSSGLQVADVLSLDRYVAEVVPREMPASWPIDALKTQAVAARTYALRVMQVARAAHRNYDICATTACQVFGGYARILRGTYQVVESTSSNIAAQHTRGWILTWHGKPILAEYSSSTGGYTTSGGVPYLAPRADPWDKGAPMHAWTEALSASQIQSRWPAIGTLRAARVTGRDGRGELGGRPAYVVLFGTAKTIYVSAQSFQYAFGLPSDWFSVGTSSGRYRFTSNLRYGQRSAAVRFLQARLRAYGFFPSSVQMSDYFGPITRDSVKRYQTAQHIPVTGFVGPMTRARLNATA
jgi:SpoIID/LytB domain protein